MLALCFLFFCGVSGQIPVLQPIINTIFCPIGTSYDYIVVGAGTTGCVVANRLSASGASVLLLEYGTRPGPINDIPATGQALTRFLDFARRYRARRSPNYCQAAVNDQCLVVVGKATGGTSAINAMFYTRGTRADFQDWVDNHGATGWSYEELEPIFKSLEKYDGPPNPAYGTEGERYLNYIDASFSEVAEPFVEAGTSMSKPFDVFLGQTNIGFTQPLTTIKDGKRQDTYDAFIEPILDSRSGNLRLLTNAFVRRVLFEGTQAVGVEYDWGLGRRCTVRANREVVVSAGAIGSPQVLMHSGIGPQQVLTPLNIDVVADLPVGQNLHDHVGTLGLSFITDRQNILESIAAELQTIGTFTSEFVEYLFTREGILSLPSLVERYGFINSSESLVEPPDIEFLLVPSTPSGPPVAAARLFAYFLNMDDATWKYTYVPRLGIDGFSILVSLMKPVSRGNLFITSPDPYRDPVIDLNYFGNTTDMDRILEGMRFALRLAEHPVMRALGTQRWDRPMLGCEDLEMWSDAYLRCLARHLTVTYYHYAGTCKMGVDSSTSVVDPRLKVHKVSGLRVMDTSIMPWINNGHPQSVCQVIGAKGAAMMLEDFNASS